MKKTYKIFLILILALTIVLMLENFVCASSLSDLTDDVEIGTQLRTEAAPAGNKILGAIKVIGAFLSVIMLMVIGIKYMLGSVEEKAEYKKTAILYILGAILLFATPQLVDLIYKAVN